MGDPFYPFYVLYDLTSTYFEIDPPDDPNDKRQFGYSREKRSDCVQVIIALVITSDGFLLAYDRNGRRTMDTREIDQNGGASRS